MAPYSILALGKDLISIKIGFYRILTNKIYLNIIFATYLIKCRYDQERIVPNSISSCSFLWGGNDWKIPRFSVQSF